VADRAPVGPLLTHDGPIDDLAISEVFSRLEFDADSNNLRRLSPAALDARRKQLENWGSRKPQ
jgi:hypothetical protein